MLRMGKLTDYATVVLASLAQEPARHRAAAELAERTRLSRPTVSKVLKGLQRAGMVISSRGSQGGYRLARDPAAYHRGANSRRVRRSDRHHRMQRRLEPVRHRAAVPSRRRVAAGQCRHSPRARGRDAASVGGARFLRSARVEPVVGHSPPRALSAAARPFRIAGVTATGNQSCQANHKKSKHSSAKSIGTASSPISNPTACRRDSMRTSCARYR